MSYRGPPAKSPPQALTLILLPDTLISCHHSSLSCLSSSSSSPPPPVTPPLPSSLPTHRFLVFIHLLFFLSPSLSLTFTTFSFPPEPLLFLQMFFHSFITEFPSFANLTYGSPITSANSHSVSIPLTDINTSFADSPLLNPNYHANSHPSYV